MQTTFCLTENTSKTEAKQNETHLSNAACMHLEDELDQAEKNRELPY